MLSIFDLLMGAERGLLCTLYKYSHLHNSCLSDEWDEFVCWARVSLAYISTSTSTPPPHHARLPETS
jgi:hypothetical protein